MRRERDAGSISDRNVWLPILASTSCVCFWLVGSARAVTRSCESFLISGLAMREPTSRSTTPTAVRISARTSSAASASLGTMRGRHWASCCGVPASICFRHGRSASMQPALTFHFLSPMPASRWGITTEATPWPAGEMESMMAQAHLMAGAPSLEWSKSGTSFSRRGRAKGVHAATLRSLAITSSLPLASLASKPSSISFIMASSAFTEGPVGAAAAASAFLEAASASASSRFSLSSSSSSSCSFLRACLTSSRSFRIRWRRVS
mmetsp:Transcript_62460/g.163953  ORF Transcript_62460/g.163953 Transcript_62460/m.163953 type:complete len:264 (+) Transcript_62460:3568-4359(+)